MHELLDGYRHMTCASKNAFYVDPDGRNALFAAQCMYDTEPMVRKFFGGDYRFDESAVILANKRDDFDFLVEFLLKVEIEKPSNPARIAQTQRNLIVMLSPDAYCDQSVYRYDKDNFKRLVMHELVHVHEEHLSPCIEVSPRWWSEGMAVYCSGQWKYEDDFRNPVIVGIANGSLPTLHEVIENPRLAYDWGWTVVMMIELIYGSEAIGRIVRECSDGDVFSCLGCDAVSMGNKWLKWLTNPFENGNLS